MTANTVDALARYPHYFDHIQPIWEELERRGLARLFYVSPSTKRPGTPTRGLPRSDDWLIVAGYPDLQRTRRPTIFVEHGIGENYNLDDPHYSGGRNRERVELFLCPNQRVADANAKLPGRSVVVGSPRLEWLSQHIPGDRRLSSGGSTDSRLRVAVSFHWNCRVHPQAGSAFEFYKPFLRQWATDPRIELVGHAHPRLTHAEKVYAAAGIPFVPRFDDVVAWADVYAVDNSSTLFEAAALGLDVVVLDSPHYTAEETGFRFWKYADIGPRISPGDDFVEATLSANYNRVSYDDLRHQMVAEVFGTVEGSTTRAADAIEATINDKSKSHPPAPGSRTDPSQPSLFSNR